MNTFRVSLTLGVLACGLALGAAAPPSGAADAARIKAHMDFLADDLLEGREAGTRGFDLAARYVAAQFAQLGLRPIAPGAGYLQPVTLRTARLVPGSAVLELQRGGSVERLAYLDEFSTRPDVGNTRQEVSSPLVFAGYGITAPGFRHDDYADLDVAGKIVVVLAGRPPAFPPDEGAHFANARVKQALAASHGAVGMITLQTPRVEAVAPFRLARQYADATYMDWLTPEGRLARELPQILGTATVSIPAAAKVLAASGLALENLVADAEAGRPLPRGELKVSARLMRQSTHGQVGSHNVVGLIEGSDLQLGKEFVVISAHLDHLGVAAGGRIYNGALDNAAGVSTLLEVARLLAQAPTPPKRSVVIIALTAEEKGELGSDFFARHPGVPASGLVANVNIDMPIWLFDFKDVVALGAERSTLKALTERAAARLGVALIRDPQPEQGRFTRSDQYSFVRQGVPAVALSVGNRSFNPAEDGAQITREFRRLRYHQPGDNLAQPIHWGAATRFAQLSFGLAIEIANSPDPIQWMAGDFFGDLFGQGHQRR